MTDTPEPPVAALLRQAGYAPRPEMLPDLDHAHALLRVMLARLGSPAPDAEPATAFRPAIRR